MSLASASLWGFQSPIGWGLSCELVEVLWDNHTIEVSIPYWLGSKLRGWPLSRVHRPLQEVSIPYWLGSKLRGYPNLI